MRPNIAELAAPKRLVSLLTLAAITLTAATACSSNPTTKATAKASPTENVRAREEAGHTLTLTIDPVYQALGAFRQAVGGTSSPTTAQVAAAAGPLEAALQTFEKVLTTTSWPPEASAGAGLLTRDVLALIADLENYTASAGLQSFNTHAGDFDGHASSLAKALGLPGP